MKKLLLAKKMWKALTNVFFVAPTVASSTRVNPHAVDPSRSSKQLATKSTSSSVAHGDSVLSQPAEIILASVLKVKFDLGVEEVKTQWSELCAGLVRVGVPTLLHVLCHWGSGGDNGVDNQQTSQEREEREVQMEVEVARQLWGVLGRQLVGGKADVQFHHWTEMMTFLLIPFGSVSFVDF